MSIISAIRSGFHNVSSAEQNFNAIAKALKNAYAIDMDFLTHVEGDQYIFNLSKGGLKLRFTISRYEFEDNIYEQIIRMNVDRFLKELEQKNALYTEDELFKAATRKAITMTGKNANTLILDDELNAAMDSIVLNDLKNAEDVNITKFSKEDLDAIQRMKEAARKIGAPGMNPIIAGGFFASIFWNQEPRDIDIFYLDGDGEDFHIPKENISLKEGEYLKNPMITQVASFSVTKRQFIFTKYKTRRELVDHFDMLHCCVSYDVKEDRLYISPASLDAIKHKAIKPNGKNKIKDWRLDKMMKRGWTMVPE